MKSIVEDEKLKELLEIFSEIIENHVSTESPVRQKGLFDPGEKGGNDKASFAAKLDLIERALEMLRIRKRQLNNNLPLDDFIQGNLEFKNNQIHFTPPIKRRSIGFGMRRIYLQPKLLIYLLFRHGKSDNKVYDIIENFVSVIWDDLDDLDNLDFEKTKTGVFRCFTNTRFAANTLRDYGLLEFTRKEAFKTWVLSFTGVMAASKFVRDGAWQKPFFVSKYRTDLHPAIKESFKELSVLHNFVNTLTFITKSNLNPSEVFTDKTERALPLLLQHHTTLQDEALSRQEKKKRCKELLSELENDEAVIKLFENLVFHLKAGDLLSIK